MRELLKDTSFIRPPLLQVTTSIRKYEPLWNRLKQDKEVTLHAPADSHPRIVQAVRKEKANDAAFRYLLMEQSRRYRLQDESSSDILKFTLIRNDPITIHSI